MELPTPFEVYSKWFEGWRIGGPRSLVKNNIIPAMQELLVPYEEQIDLLKKENEDLKQKLANVKVQVTETLRVLEIRRKTTPGLGAPIVILKVALEEIDSTS